MNNILYSAIILDEESKIKLYETFKWLIPFDYKIFCNHMTIVFGKGIPNKDDLGKNVTLAVTHIGWTDKVIAVKVEGYESVNKVAHITVAVNPDGGKPVMSNDITNWQNVKRFVLEGVVTEIKASK